MESREGTYTFAPLDPKRHDRSSFSCGEPSLDHYLKTQASQDSKRRFSACFIAGTPSGRIAGYYTLSAHAVWVNDLPASLHRRLPSYPSIPAFLLGRLAVDLAYRTTGLGSALLADALSRALKAEIPAYAVVVEALNESAASFYVHFGFIRLASAPHRFFLPLATIPG